MTILLIDDDEDDRDIFKEAITVIHPEVHFMVARDGEEGLALLEELTILPDYIFLDVNMPVMDGKEFLKRVKASDGLKEIPVVVYSTSKHQSELGEYFSMGASNYITKPSEFNLLLTYLKTVLK